MAILNCHIQCLAIYLAILRPSWIYDRSYGMEKFNLFSGPLGWHLRQLLNSRSSRVLIQDQVSEHRLVLHYPHVHDNLRDHSADLNHLDGRDCFCIRLQDHQWYLIERWVCLCPWGLWLLLWKDLRAIVGVMAKGISRSHLKDDRLIFSLFASLTSHYGARHKYFIDLLPDCSNYRELQQGVSKPQELEVPLSQ
jgi:hypothetical protein